MTDVFTESAYVRRWIAAGTRDALKTDDHTQRWKSRTLNTAQYFTQSKTRPIAYHKWKSQMIQLSTSHESHGFTSVTFSQLQRGIVDNFMFVIQFRLSVPYKTCSSSVRTWHEGHSVDGFDVDSVKSFSHRQTFVNKLLAVYYHGRQHRIDANGLIT